MTNEEAIEVIKDLIDTYVVCHGEEDMVAVSLDNVDVDALDMAIKALEQEPKWIPVSERLPEEETDVLICNKQGEIEISQGSRSTEVDAFIWYTSGWRFGEVIAWMPLPEPYKAESEDKE